MIVTNGRGIPVAELRRTYLPKFGHALKIQQGPNRFITIPLDSLTRLADALVDADEAIATQN